MITAREQSCCGPATTCSGRILAPLKFLENNSGCSWIFLWQHPWSLLRKKIISSITWCPLRPPSQLFLLSKHPTVLVCHHCNVSAKLGARVQVAEPRAPRWWDVQLLFLELLTPWLLYTPWKFILKQCSVTAGLRLEARLGRSFISITAPFLHTPTVLEPNWDTTALWPLHLFLLSPGTLSPPTHLMCPHRPQFTSHPTKAHTGVLAILNYILLSSVFMHCRLGLYWPGKDWPLRIS